MRIIKDKVIADDDRKLIRELENAAACPDGPVILPFSYWQANRDALIKANGEHAVWIDGAVEVEDLIPYLQYFSLIALDFPAFKDGRCYSHARLLRDRFGFEGELRAVGDVLRDQMFFMHRCGINSFHLRDDKDIEDALNAFNEFTVRYQTAADGAVPIYKLR